jgi:hypothetical protein
VFVHGSKQQLVVDVVEQSLDVELDNPVVFEVDPIV